VGVDSSTARRLLVLGAGPAQLGLLRAAREEGLFVIACDRDPSAPGFEYADRRAIVSAEDEEGLDRLARAESVDGVISPGIDWPVAIAARVAERLGVAHPLAPETAAMAVSKLRQRERFAEDGVPQPRYAVCSSIDDAEAAAGDLGYPCVVKAPDRQGQRGLSYVEAPGELEEAVELALQASRSRTCLVEELVPGREVTVNAFSTAGRFHPLTVTDRITADPPAFGVALAHAWPAAGSARAAQAAERAARRLGVLEGPTYTQVVLGADGPRVVELAARLGGGHDAELCRVALGIDLNRLALGAALGEHVEIPAPAPIGGACVRFLVAPEGELVRVEGTEEALEVEGIVEARAYRRPGWKFGPLRRGADRAGFVLAAGSSRDDALARADRAAECVRFVTADAEAAVEFSP
jgi:biotin carboxylase